MIGRWSTPPVEEEAKPKGFDDFDLRLGDVMRGERATMGKSLLDVQRELKIKATYIAAIENADPSAFETQGFVAGYVRSYARYLSLDPEWAYLRFCEEGKFTTAHGMSPAASGSRSNAAEKAQSKVPRDPFADPDALYIPRGEAMFSRIEPSAIGSSLVLVALIGVIGFGGWSVFKEIQKVQFTPVEQAPGVASTLDGLDSQGTIVTADNDNSSGFQPPSIEAMDRLYRPQALDVPVMVARDGPISTLDPRSIGALVPEPDEEVLTAEQSIATPDTPVGTPDIQVVAADVPDVVMFAVRPSWVRVSAADGTVLFEKILDAGEEYVLPKSAEPPLLRAGNAGSVYFAVNGHNYGPAGVGPSVVKNVALSPDALKNSYAMADLSKDKDLAQFVAVAQANLPTASE